MLPIPLVLVAGRRPVHPGKFLQIGAVHASRGGRHLFARRPAPMEQLVLGRRHLQVDAWIVAVTRGRAGAGRGRRRVEAPGPLSRAAAAGGHAQR